jgi:hypothetical protein
MFTLWVRILRIPRQKREAAAYIILRRKGFSINTLAGFFGRSRSFIHRILKAVNLASAFDLRKLPTRTKLLASIRLAKTLQKVLSQWEAWILGDGDKPP